MDSYQLLFVCLSALLAVFVLLTILAVTMRLLVAVFPEKLAKSDAALLAAVTTAVASIYPGMRVTRVEEEK
ncbi:MAG: hypothetical protein GTO46_12755 [Gemmatimonadetes bacterium]|nr:hypothetical protein [Gemmatimonadota bacterium]NIO32459.1 hypothetical protein [Gemmatimonadota bacterium]